MEHLVAILSPLFGKKILAATQSCPILRPQILSSFVPLLTTFLQIAPPHPTSLQGLVPQLNPLPIVGLQKLDYHNLKKKLPKVVKSIYCPVCKIDCNSQGVLNNHKLGRKHRRNLEKLTESLNLESSQPMPLLPSTGTKSGNKTDRKKNKSTPASAEELETKKRKVIEGGAAQEAVKVCTICNVVCNSDVVFNYHLAGQKHAAMVKKLGAVAS